MAGRRARPIYHILPGADVDLSTNGRRLAYSDRGGYIHLVDLRNGTSHILGRGVGPRFSPGGRALAFIAGATAPLPGAKEWLEVYQLSSARLTRLGPALVVRTGTYDPALLIAWSPNGDHIAWVEPNSKGTDFRLATATLGFASVTVTVTPLTGVNGVAWSVTGDSILYWHFASPARNQQAATVNAGVMGWRVPDGPASIVVPEISTSWIEGAAPAPVPDPRGATIASLLGSPHGGLYQILLYTLAGGVRAIPLPGAPTAVRYAPAGTQFAAIWTQLRGNTPVSYAGLVDPMTRRVRDLGPALAAFWIAPAS
jgi:hypothetical protein